MPPLAVKKLAELRVSSTAGAWCSGGAKVEVTSKLPPLAVNLLLVDVMLTTGAVIDKVPELGMFPVAVVKIFPLGMKPVLKVPALSVTPEVPAMLTFELGAVAETVRLFNADILAAVSIVVPLVLVMMAVDCEAIVLPEI